MAGAIFYALPIRLQIARKAKKKKGRTPVWPQGAFKYNTQKRCSNYWGLGATPQNSRLKKKWQRILKGMKHCGALDGF